MIINIGLLVVPVLAGILIFVYTVRNYRTLRPAEPAISRAAVTEGTTFRRNSRVAKFLDLLSRRGVATTAVLAGAGLLAASLLKLVEPSWLIPAVTLLGCGAAASFQGYFYRMDLMWVERAFEKKLIDENQRLLLTHTARAMHGPAIKSFFEWVRTTKPQGVQRSIVDRLEGLVDTYADSVLS